MMTLDYIAANSPCVDCNALSGCASSELTAQCTDQCVVIACNDPDHGEAPCVGGEQHAQCDPTCGEKTFDCTGCYGFDTDSFLQCCDDYQQKIGESQQISLDNEPFTWAPSLDEFWCACGQSDTPKSPVSQESSANMSSNVPLSSSLGHTDLAQTTFQVDPFSPRDFSKPHIHMHGCMWGNCTSSFSSLSELRDHVVLVHLESLPPTDSPPNHNISAQYGSQSSLDTPCLWSKCDNSYQPHSIFTSPQSLYTHLMKDHLQVWSPVDNRGQMSTPMEPVMQDTFDNMSPISHHGSTFAPVIPHATSDSTPETLASTEDSNSTHRCCWTGCSSYFSTCDELTTHIISDHIGSRKAQYDCFWEGCPRNGAQGFQSKQKICRHVQSHTGHRPFQCSICEQKFSEAATLQQHIRRHTQEKPYLCDYPGCNKSFAITGALTIHKRTHNGDKPFICSYCNRGFAESSNLSKHLRTHTGARPYICGEPGCSKRFARPDQLSRHRGVHSKQVGSETGMSGKVSARQEPVTS